MRYTEIKKLIETMQLDEVSMSPSTLQKFLNSPEADGMMIGIEFEMAVPNVDAGGEQEPDYQPDYEYNQSCGSIREIIDFFRDGDFSNMNRDDADRAHERLWEEYAEWTDNFVDHHIVSNEDDLLDNVRSKLDDEIDRDDVAEEAHTRWSEEHEDEDGTTDKAEEEIRNLTLQMIEDRLDDMMLDASSSEYQDAYDNAKQEMEDEVRQDSDCDEEAWLSDIGVDDMRDAERYWNFDWPHMFDENYSDDGGDINVDEVADEFAEAMGLDKVNSSDSYHGARRDGVHWCIEPDGSIDSNDGDGGLEFISPPLPLKAGLEQMHKIIAWANDKGCYTNRSTGLHMNISVPDFKLENLDYVKLALFMGDEHILKEFGRSMNTYCKSALSIVKEKVADRSVTDALLKQMREHLNIAASKAVHNGTTNKFTSINTKGGYVEFRGPGGDYLSQDINKLINTALRLAQSLRIAIDPLAHKQEYAKKLYKLASPEGNDESDNSVAMFSRYAMGAIKKDELLEKLRQTKITRLAKKFPNGPKRNWKIIRKSNPGFNISIKASTPEEALRLAKAQYAPWADVEDVNFKITPEGDNEAFQQARKEHARATLTPFWSSWLDHIDEWDIDRLENEKRRVSHITPDDPNVYSQLTPDQQAVILEKIETELSKREGDAAAIGAVDDVEQLPPDFRNFVRDIRNKTETVLNSTKSHAEDNDYRRYLNDGQKTILLNAINAELAHRQIATMGVTRRRMPANLSSQWQSWLEGLDSKEVSELQHAQSIIVNRQDMTSEQRDYVTQEIVAELDRRGASSAIDNNDTRWKVIVSATTGSRTYEPVYVDADSPRQAKIKAQRLFFTRQGVDFSIEDLDAIATTPDAGTTSGTPATISDENRLVISRLPRHWQEFMSNVDSALGRSLDEVKTRLETRNDVTDLTDNQIVVCLQEIDNEIARRTARIAATGDVSQVTLQPADLPETWSNWVREMNSTTNEVLNTMKGHLEHIQSGVNINLLPPIYRRLTERQVPYLLQQINNTLASRTAATTDTSDDDDIPENWRNWVDTLANRPLDSINDVRAQVQSGAMNVGLETTAAKNAVINAIDDELRRRQATSDLADGNATSREIFDSLGPVWQNWLQSISNLQDHMLEGMIRTIEAESGDIVMLTVRQRDFIKSTIHQELRRRSTNNAVAALRPGGALHSDTTPSEVAGTRTYTIYDSMDRIVNTIRSTSAARALDEFGENNDIDTTHYTARLTVQQAADHVIPTPGPGQSWYSVEHIPTGQVTRVIGNDAADAIQRQATATGGLPMSLRIAQATSDDTGHAGLPDAHREWLENIADHSDINLINVLNHENTPTVLNDQQAAYFRIIIKRELRRRDINPDEATPSPATTYADDADERERMRSERERISQDMAREEQEWVVGNHTYGRETLRAPDREEAIRRFAFANGITIFDVVSGPGFVAEPAAQTNESIDLIRKLAGLK